MTKNKLITLISCLVISIVALTVSIKYDQKTKEMEIATNALLDVSENKFVQEVTPKEVNEYEETVHKNFDKFLSGNSGDFSEEGYQFLKSLFVQTGKPPVSQDTDKQFKSDYYSEFSYELSNFAIKATSENFNEFEVITNISVSFLNQHQISGLISIKLDKNEGVIGGNFYGRI